MNLYQHFTEIDGKATEIWQTIKEGSINIVYKLENNTVAKRLEEMRLYANTVVKKGDVTDCAKLSHNILNFTCKQINA